jgi:hypothetical protein
VEKDEEKANIVNNGPSDYKEGATVNSKRGKKRKPKVPN